MGGPAHLGVVCVDVSELLKAHSQMKVERRDNMILHNGSYLITDPLSSVTPRKCNRTRTSIKTSPSRGANSKATPMTVRTTSSEKMRSSSRRGRSKKRNHGKGDRNNKDGQCPTASGSSLVPQTKGDHVIDVPVSDAKGRKKERGVPVVESAGGDYNTRMSLSAWSNNKCVLSSLHDPCDTNPQSPLGLQSVARQTTSRAVGEQDQPKQEPHQTSGQFKSQEDKPFFERVGAPSECVKSAVDPVMKSLQDRLWDNLHGSPDTLPCVPTETARHEQRRNSAAKGTEGNPSVTFIGTLGAAKPPRSPDRWGAPRSQRRTSLLCRKKSVPTSPANSCRLVDSRGVERVLIMGVVPKLPKRAALRGSSLPRKGLGTESLPPACRRAARFAAAAVPTTRPKRF